MKQFNPKIEPSFHDKNQKYDISLEFVRDLIGYDALNMVHNALIQAGYVEMIEVIKALRSYLENKESSESKNLFNNLVLKLEILDEKHGMEVVNFHDKNQKYEYIGE